MARKSIGIRLRKSPSLDQRREYALDWATAWRTEHDALIRRLEQAVGQGRLSDAGFVISEIKEASGKKFAALPGVIDALTDPEIE